MMTQPLLPLEEGALVLLVLLALLAWPLWRSSRRLPRRRRVTALVLRLLGLAGLAALALNPGRWERERADTPRVWAVLVDRSESMATADVDGASRWAAANRMVDRLLRASTQPDHVRLYTFADGVEPARDARELAGRRPDGGATRLEEAGLHLLARHRTRTDALAGVLMLSDGRRVEAEPPHDLGLQARAQSTPLHVLPLGGPVEQPDASVRIGRRQVVAFAGQPVRVTPRVRVHGFGPLRIPVRLETAQGEAVAERVIELAGDGETPVLFELDAAPAGYTEYVVRLPDQPGEARTENNRAVLGVSTLPGRLRVLMLEGTPFWDSKFLARRLRRQPNLELTAVYRMTADRFFAVRDDERPDPVQLDTLFAEGADGLGGMDLVMLGKGLDSMLTPDRIDRLKRYVRDGGRVLFFRGKPYPDRLELLEPLEPLVWGAPLAADARLAPGVSRAAAELFGDLLPAAGDPAWARLPSLKQVHHARAHAFTEILAEAQASEGARDAATPLLAFRPYGRGLLGVVNAEGFWTWDFFPERDESQEVYQEFWVQVLHWMMLRADFMPGRALSITLSAAAVRTGEPVRVAVRPRTGRTGDGPVPRLSLWRGDARGQEIPLTTAREGEALWEGILTLSEPGLIRVRAERDGDDGAQSADTLLLVEAPPGERDEVSADPGRLARLAEVSGGRVVDPNQLDALVRELEQAPAAEGDGETIWVSLWDRSWVLLWILGCSAGDLFIRRRNGLA